MRSEILACVMAIAGIAITVQIYPGTTGALARPGTPTPSASFTAVRFDNVTFTYDRALASQVVGYKDTQTRLAICDAQGTRAVRFAFKNYLVPKFGGWARVTVVPITALKRDRCVSTWTKPELTRMTTLLRTRPNLATLRSLPMVPTLDTVPLFYVRTKYLRFGNGTGISFVSAYSGGLMRVTNDLPVFYSFQGMTDDRRFWVSVYLPLHVPILPAGSAVGTPLPTNYQAYVQGVKKQLLRLADAGYRPNLKSLDTLVQSIRAKPTDPRC